MLAGVAVPVIEDGKLVGIIEMGGLINGATEKVDAIRDAVFANEIYNGKPVGTATIFLDDLRISTNVLDQQGRRAVGTRASKEVADTVLGQGVPWTGPAQVVGTPYLAQYDPIRDPDGKLIGMLYVGELEQKYVDLLRRTLFLNLGVILAGMTLAFLLIYFLVRGIVRPIHALSEATHQLAAGELSHRVDIQRSDEIGDLAQDFDRMGERLQTQRDELERDKQQLTTLSEQLQTTNRNYIEMLGFVTHELKNPLTSAIMGLYTVKDGYLGELNAGQKKEPGIGGKEPGLFPGHGAQLSRSLPAGTGTAHRQETPHRPASGCRRTGAGRAGSPDPGSAHDRGEPHPAGTQGGSRSHFAAHRLR